MARSIRWLWRFCAAIAVFSSGISHSRPVCEENRCNPPVDFGYGLLSDTGVYTNSLVGTSCDVGVPGNELWCASLQAYGDVACRNRGDIKAINLRSGAGASPYVDLFDCLRADGSIYEDGVAFRNGVCEWEPPYFTGQWYDASKVPNSPYISFGFWACIEPKTGPSKKKNKGPPECGQGCGNPINAGTGNKFQSETDFAARELPGLEFVRYYNSIDTDDGAGSLAPGWTHSFDRSIYVYGVPGVTAVNVVARRPDGREYVFYQSGTNWVADADNVEPFQELVDSGGVRLGWRYTTKENDVENYDPSGTLLSIDLQSGRRLTLTYSDASTPATVAPAPGMLIRVDHDSGRTLSLTYTSTGALATVSAPAGYVVTYDYDSIGNLVRVTLPGGTSRQYSYNESAYTGGASLPFALTGITDENGNRFATFQYQADGKAISTEHSGGVEKYVATYSADSTNVMDPFGTSRAYSLTTRQGVVKTTAVSAPCTWCSAPPAQSTTFDTNGNITSKVDFNGNLTCFAYDAIRNLENTRTEGLDGTLGNCVSRVATSATRTITTEWHPTWRLPKRVAEPLRIMTIAYHGEPGISCAPSGASTLLPCSKTVQATSDPNGTAGFSATPVGPPRTWTYTYNAAGQPLTVDGPRTDVADVITNTYYASNDPAGNYREGDLATTTNALGQTKQFTHYDDAGRLKRIVDPNGLETLLDYWPRGWIRTRSVGTATAGYEITSYSFDDAGQLTGTTMPDGSSIGYRYDAAHRVYEVFDGLNNRITYTLDNAGNRIREESRDPAGALKRALSREYNAQGQLWRAIGGSDPANQVTEFAYDLNGNVTSITDPAFNVTTQGFDALNRLDSIVDAVNGPLNPTRYSYNGLGAIASVTEPLGAVTTYATTGHGEVTVESSPNTGTTTTTFDAAGNVLSRQDARGVVQTRTYDAANRVTGILYPDETVTFTYDACQHGVGRLCSIADKSGTTSYSYDPLGRIATKSQSVDGVTHVVSYTYNPGGTLAAMVTPGGRQVNYTYGNGRPISVAVDGNVVLDDVQWEPFGPNGGWRWSNSTASTANFHDRIHDGDYRLRLLVSDRPTDTAGNPILNKDIAWDAADRITQIADVGSSALPFQYGYDNLNRLYYAFQDANSWDYSIDGGGDRISSYVNGAFSAMSYVPGTHRLSSISGAMERTYTHDFAGNTLSDGVRTWVYGGSGRPSQVTSKGVTTGYAFNALGQRVKKSSRQGGVLFFYDEAGRVMGEYSLSGTAVSEFIWLEDLPVAVVAAQPAVTAEQIVDNGASGFSTAGAWTASTSVAGFYGPNYLTHAPGANAVGAVVVDNADAGFSTTGQWVASTSVAGYLGPNYQVHEANGAPPTAVVVDNSDPGFSATGTWAASSSIAGYLGSNYLTHSPNGPPIGAIVSDNSDASSTVTGTWPASTSASGYFGTNYQTHAGGTGANDFAWNVSLPQSGTYQVYGRWTGGTNRANNASYAVTTATGLQSVSVNQQLNGGAWNLLGTWAFDAGVATISLSDNANGYVIADAIMLVPANALPSTATWQANLPSAGTWQVYARWTKDANRATNATYVVQTETGAQSVAVDQTANGGKWNLLGTWEFAAGSASISLTDQANGFVIADAVMLVPPGAAPSTATWQASIPTAGRWRVSARWTSDANRATNATYSISTTTGAVAAIVNQQANGGAWQPLGTFDLPAGTSSVGLTDQADGVVIADAVKFEPDGSQPESAIWTPSVPGPTEMTIYARWSAGSNRAGNAQYVIRNQSGSTTVAQDQRVNGGTWNLLGTFTLGPGDNVSLLSNDQGYVVADAVKFVAASGSQPAAGLFYVHPDHLGTPRLITRPSDDRVVWRWDNLDPFGDNPANENPSAVGTFAFNLRFPGQYFDAETGTHYNYFRDYDPAIGRYVQSDPIGQWGGINTYGYVGASPLKYMDRDGLQFSPDSRDRPDGREGRERPGEPRPIQPGEQSFDLDGEKQYCYAMCMQRNSDKNFDTTLKTCGILTLAAGAGGGPIVGMGMCVSCVLGVGTGLTISSDSDCRSECFMAKGFKDRLSDALSKRGK